MGVVATVSCGEWHGSFLGRPIIGTANREYLDNQLEQFMERV